MINATFVTKVTFLLLILGQFSAFPGIVRDGLLASAVVIVALVTAAAPLRVLREVGRLDARLLLFSLALLLVLLVNSYGNPRELSYIENFYVKFLILVVLVAAIRSARANVREAMASVCWALCVHSLAGWMLQPLLPMSFVSNDNYAGNTFLSVFYYMAGTGFEIGPWPYRNQGLMSEPGLLALAASYLFIDASERRSPKKSARAVSLLTLLTTFSVGGAVIVGAYAVLRWIGPNRRRMLAASGFLAMAALLTLRALWVSTEELDLTTIASTAARVFDIAKGFDAIMHSPVWGWGIDPVPYLAFDSNFSTFSNDIPEEILSQERKQSNSVVRIFISFGVPLGAYYLARLASVGTAKPRFAVPMMIALLVQPIGLSFLCLAFFILSFAPARPAAPALAVTARAPDDMELQHPR